MPFDKESGQIFNETTVRVRRHCKCSPYRSRKGVKPPAIEERHVSRSLQDMAIRTLLRNLPSLDEHALRPLPSHILERLWSMVKYHFLDSIHIWQLFASLGAMRTDHRRWKQTETACQRHGLKANIKWATSASVHWLTNLTIVELNCSVDELMYISELSNLRNLAVQAGDHDRTRVSDSIMREWAYSAKQHGAFAFLQTVFLGGQNVTSWCLQYLDQFPNLDTFCAFWCKFGDRDSVGKIAQQSGWSLDKRNGTCNETLDHLCRVSAHARDMAYRAYSYVEHRRSTEQSPANNLPHLHLNFGCAGKNSKSRMQRFSVADPGFFCFDRNRDSKSPEAQVANGDIKNQRNVAGQAPPVKRRKVKDSKSVPLQQHIFFDD